MIRSISWVGQQTFLNNKIYIMVEQQTLLDNKIYIMGRIPNMYTNPNFNNFLVLPPYSPLQPFYIIKVIKLVYLSVLVLEENSTSLGHCCKQQCPLIFFIYCSFKRIQIQSVLYQQFCVNVKQRVAVQIVSPCSSQKHLFISNVSQIFISFQNTGQGQPKWQVTLMDRIHDVHLIARIRSVLAAGPTSCRLKGCRPKLNTS